MGLNLTNAHKVNVKKCRMPQTGTVSLLAMATLGDGTK
jgi:hypothetical protein